MKAQPIRGKLSGLHLPFPSLEGLGVGKGVGCVVNNIEKLKINRL
jgi:hypothetical protein